MAPAKAANGQPDIRQKSLTAPSFHTSSSIVASGGLTIPSRGIGGHWTVKLPSRDFRRVPENEFSMMTLAKMVGIDVPAIDLVDVSSIKNLPDGIDHLGSKAFIIERFDRMDDLHSVHIEELWPPPCAQNLRNCRAYAWAK